MKPLPAPLAGLQAVLKQPRTGFRWLVDLNHHRNFERWPGAYRGVFPSFAAAGASAPAGKVGFDHAELAGIYDHRLDRVFPSDYPVLFWLTRIFRTSTSLFDWGGHIGISFYAYERYLEFPTELRWRVCDVPQIVTAGRTLAATRGATRLSFTTDPAEASGFDVLLAAGSLQFLEAPFAAHLASLSQRPRHLLVNKLPLHAGPTFFTLQNTVHSYTPYKVENRREFIESVEAQGYELVDRWETPDLSCRIPLYPDHCIDAYSGFYFRAR